jgi:single-strand DNA-binding protein
MVVERPEGAPGPRVDTLDCASWRADIRRASAGWKPGDVLSVEGRLRRRFWRAGAGVASRYEVEVSRVRRLSRAS